MPVDDGVLKGHHAIFSRLWRNVGWLLGGQGLAGLFGLLFLAIAARSLGPARFGLFVIALTYAQFFSNISHFESWKGVIRFGALHLADSREIELSRLLGFTATLDWASAISGAAIAIVAAFLVGPLINWPVELQRQAAVFAAILIVASGGTPTGILRLFNRFDLLAYTEAFAPLSRFLIAIIAWLLGGGVSAFLAAWALGAMLQLLAIWVAALTVHRGRLALGLRSFRAAGHENHGLWNFMWRTSLSSSLRYISMQAGTLAVGSVAGPTTAGGFRLADRIATATTKPSEQLARVIYPELAHLVASNDRELLRRLLVRSALISLTFAVVVVGLCVGAGGFILRVVAGPQFTFAQPFLAILAIAAAIELSGFVLEPWHNAHGGAAIILRARIAGAAIYALLLMVLLPLVGALGAAAAAVASSAAIVGVLAVAAFRMLNSDPARAQATREEAIIGTDSA